MTLKKLNEMPMHPIFDSENKLFYGFWTNGWRTVIGFEKYEVNHISQVRNKKTQKLLKPIGDFTVNLYDQDGNHHSKRIYHLTLQAFFPHILQNERDVDHIDEDHSNNHINNLQWIRPGLNSRKSLKLRPRNHGPKQSRPIEQWSKDKSLLIQEFTSVSEAKRHTHIDQRNISSCAHGKQSSAGGYFWKFRELESQNNLPGEEWSTNDCLRELLPNPKIRVSNMGRILTAKGIKTKGTKIPGTCGHRKFRGYKVHQLVWAVWGDGRPVPKKGDDLMICHNDSVPRDEDGCASNAIQHLRLDTQSENAKEYHREKAKKRKFAEIYY